jgi:hypothetical protein
MAVNALPLDGRMETFTAQKKPATKEFQENNRFSKGSRLLCRLLFNVATQGEEPPGILLLP